MANESDKIIPENIGNSELINPREQLVAEALRYLGYKASNYYGPNGYDTDILLKLTSVIYIQDKQIFI